MNLILRPFCREDYKFLYELLQQRDKKCCISHKGIPSVLEHIKFWESAPYKEAYIIDCENKPIGAVYISKLKEVGIHLIKGHNGGIKKAILTGMMDKIKYANVSPNDRASQKLFKSLGFKLIQYTYEKVIH